jgi:gluconate 2-dehydrogenase alpha chain
VIEHAPVDLCVIGLGAAGGTIASEAAHAGLSVVGLEAGPDHDPTRAAEEFDTDEVTHVVDLKLQWAEPEMLIFEDGPPIPFPWLARNIGVGGPHHWSGFSFRFHPSDFRVASECGVPDGSSVADWPISYDDLEPFYEATEVMFEVSAGTTHPWEPERHAPFPQPPLPDSGRARMLTDAAIRLGWNPYRPPAGVLTRAEPGGLRQACNLCGHCTHFGCTRNAKASTLVTVLPAARATGHLEVRANSRATEVLVDDTGRPRAVQYIETDGEEHVQPAKVIVLATNAPYVAKLMLQSRSDHHPHGLGNQHDQVGRHATFHTSMYAYGVFDDLLLHAERGPALHVAIDDFSEGRPHAAGASFRRGAQLTGGMPATFAGGPLSFALALGDWLPLPDGVPSYGDGLLEFAAHAFPRHMAVFCLGEDLPRAENRVTLDPDLVDGSDRPALRIEYAHHPEDRAQIAYMLERAEQWLREAGADTVVSAAPPIPGGIRAGHAHGTTRMGTDPERSVTDDMGRVHGFDNLFSAGAGTFVTSAAFNPCLTIVALALRSAPAIIAAAS